MVILFIAIGNVNDLKILIKFSTLFLSNEMYECMSVYLPEIAYCTTHFIVEKNIIILPLARREINIWYNPINWYVGQKTNQSQFSSIKSTTLIFSILLILSIETSNIKYSLDALSNFMQEMNLLSFTY